MQRFTYPMGSIGAIVGPCIFTSVIRMPAFRVEAVRIGPQEVFRHRGFSSGPGTGSISTV